MNHFLLLIALVALIGSAFAYPDMRSEMAVEDSIDDVITALEKVLTDLHVGANLQTCVADTKTVYDDLQQFVKLYEAKSYEPAVKQLSTVFSDLSGAIQDCDLDEVSSIFSQFSALLSAASVELNKDLTIYVQGQDVAKLIEKLAVDWKARDVDAVGKDVALLTGYLLPLIKCTSEECQIAAGLLRILEVVATDLGPCEADVVKAGTILKNAMTMWHRDHQEAVLMFAKGLRTLGDAMDTCGIADLSSLVVEEANKILHADITVWGDHVKVIVDAVDVGEVIYDAIAALEAHDWVKFGTLCGQLVADLRASSCTSKVCVLVEGMLEAADIFFPDLGTCEKDLSDGYHDLDAGLASILHGHVKSGVAQTAKGLDTFGKAVEACHVPQLAQLLQAEAKKLGLGDVSGFGRDVKLIVAGIDVFDDIYQAAVHMNKHDFPGAGQAIGDLLRRVRATSCTSEACHLLEGLLEALDVVLPDLSECEADITKTYAKFTEGGADVKSGQWGKAIHAFADGIDELSVAVDKCHIDELASLLTHEADRLHSGEIKKAGEIIHIIVGSLDLFDDIDQAAKAFEAGDAKSFGYDLGNVVKGLKSIGCNTNECKLAEGILSALGEAIVDFAPCAPTLDKALKQMEHGVALIEKEKWAPALAAMNSGLEYVSQACETCLIPHLQDDINNFAKLFKGGSVKDVTTDLKVLVAGIDVLEDLVGAGKDFKAGEYVQFGRDLGNVMSAVDSIIGKDKCDNEKWCLLFNGIVSGMNIFLPDMKVCKHDGLTVWNELEETFHAFSGKHYGDAVHDLAKAVDEMDALVHDCDVEELVDLLARLATLLGSAEVSWIAELVHIIIHGLDIAHDMYDLVEDIEKANILGAGIDVAYLVKVLVM